MNELSSGRIQLSSFLLFFLDLFHHGNHFETTLR